MIDESQELTPEPKTENQVIEPKIVSQASKTSKNYLWLVLSIGIAIICLCSCSVACLALIATGAGKIMVERAPIESVLDTFMTDMEAKDVEGAYTLFSPRSQRQTPFSSLEKMDQGNDFILFEGYENLSVQSLNLTAAVNTNPDLPQGTIATVSGVINYKDGFTGQFKAVLEKVDGIWKIHNINVTVPPDKFQ